MFESAELGHRITKDVWDREVPPLREALLDAQYDLATAKFPVILLVAGVDGSGKSETVNTLNEWMDPRHIQTHGLDDPTLMDAAQLAGVTACMRRAGLDVSVAPMVEAASNAAAASRIDALAADVTGAGGRFRVTVRVLPV